MRNFLMAAAILTSLGATSLVAAHAEDFGGGNGQTGINAYLNEQATNAQLSDPTAPDSVRSHGRP